MPPLDRMTELHASFRFVVRVDNINYAAFSECTLPTLQVETQDIKEGGQNAYTHKLPVRVNAGTIKLKHGVMQNDELLKWYMLVLAGKIKDATRDVQVILFNSDSKIQVATWTFNKAYPIRYGGPALKADTSVVAVEELELAHHGFTVV
jgi:phage tail-like protein